ncbi:aminotransferase class I/II-fold pyridoxal phosphate-dependent enzyme [Kitasatospora sp. NPDC093550]|uniref:aminotransferase class I/II-fold pyridoxal phosphate-dependent enzyme n=1 Tax=Kitasatospora sp. NPDC093550 TaxID=3364089 RepID=UPI00380D69D2
MRATAAVRAGRTAGCLVERPGFAPIPELLGGHGVVRQLSWGEMFSLAGTATAPMTLWLTSPGRNPDGRSLSAAERALLGDLVLAGHQVWVNRVYRWFDAEDGAGPAGAEHHSAPWWSVDSLSKLCGGGSRLGWVTGPEDVEHPAGLRTSGPSTIWQRSWAFFLDAAASHALHVQCVEPTVAARRAFLDRLRSELGWTFTGLEAGVSVTLAVPGPSESAAVALFEEHGLRVSPGSAFGMTAVSVRLAFSGVTEAESRAAAGIVARLAVAGLCVPR